MYSAYVSQEPFLNPGSSTLSSYPSDWSRQKQHFSVGSGFPCRRKCKSTAEALAEGNMLLQVTELLKPQRMLNLDLEGCLPPSSC